MRLFASARSWIEGEAVRQLYAAANLTGVRHAAGFPDLHPGKGAPVGAAFVTEGVIYPHLIGGDIGCGMAFFKTDLVRRDAKLDRWAEMYFHLEHPWDEDVERSSRRRRTSNPRSSTPGSAQSVAATTSPRFKRSRTSLTPARSSRLALAKHSSSCSFTAVRAVWVNPSCAHMSDQHFGYGVEADSFAAEEYLRGHDFAVRWAKANRELIARRFAGKLGARGRTRLWDGCHNSITRHES